MVGESPDWLEKKARLINLFERGSDLSSTHTQETKNQTREENSQTDKTSQDRTGQDKTDRERETDKTDNASRESPPPNTAENCCCRCCRSVIAEPCARLLFSRPRVAIVGQLSHCR